ncbi:MAG TPA: hypothetical protein VJ652_16980 [Noviherbaspirillum sp.]|nr:hypothetical protein [Noviherbaspirillum sp.]
MRRAGGFTIVQIMLFLFIAGILAWAATEAIIEKRCESDPSATLCAGR